MSGCRERFVIAGDVLRAIIVRAQSHTDVEIVGFLAGTEPGIATRDVPLPNLSNDGSSFVVPPFSQFLAEREVEARGEQIVAIYHSHPYGDATLSELDVHFASGWRCAHIVIGLKPVPVARAYQLNVATTPMELPLAERWT